MMADAVQNLPVDPLDPVPEVKPGAPRRTPLTVKVVTVALLLVLATFIGVQAQSLWQEWRGLRKDLAHARWSTVVGYKNIHLNPSYAAIPKNWYHDDGDATMLWSGWTPGVGHGWFRVGRGDLEYTSISIPIGRDVIQAIDWPLVEVGGGPLWQRIPWDAPVAGALFDGVASVYPMLVLRKVEVVNDQVQNRPVLVLFTPFMADEEAVSLYDPVIDGKRITLGSSGYFRERRPLLYDRGTESLWINSGDKIDAIAGKLKGKSLPKIGKPTLVSWGTWRDQHPDSRLIVGADRSRGRPLQ